jgi:DNA sulfur modification protein DndD
VHFSVANNATPLPWNLPDKETMQEMIDDEICKVCGRPAEKGSDAYNFMVNKLNEYLDHIRKESEAAQQQEASVKPLFENTYINELTRFNKSLAVLFIFDKNGKIREVRKKLNQYD